MRIYPRELSAVEIASLVNASPDANSGSAWFFRYTGNTAPTSADWAADPDGDGFANLLEYALGGNPGLASPTIAPAIGADNSFAFLRKRTGISQARYQPEYSSDLKPGSWLPLSGSADTLPTADPDFEKIIIPLPPTSEGRIFARLRVGDE